MSINEGIQKNRLWNFRQIINAVGGVNEAARLMGKKNSYITAISGPNPNRSIGNQTAASIEKTFGLEPGSLDADPPKESRNNDELLAKLSATLANASNTDKEFVISVAEFVVNRSLKLPSTTTGTSVKASDVDPI